MGDIFDSTRRKLARTITTHVVPDAVTAKFPEWKLKAMAMGDDFVNSDRFRRRFEAEMEWAAKQHICKYFQSKEFKNKCVAAAKGLLK